MDVQNSQGLVEFASVVAVVTSQLPGGADRSYGPADGFICSFVPVLL